MYRELTERVIIVIVIVITALGENEASLTKPETLVPGAGQLLRWCRGSTDRDESTVKVA